MQKIYSCLLFLLIVIAIFPSCEKVVPITEDQIHSESSADFLSSKKPNILIIFVDDVGYEIPSYTGGQTYSTPNIDRLAFGGRQFTQCHSSPMCSPSRFTIMTGKYNFRNYTYWGKMDPNEKTIGNLMSDAGYATYYTGKWQLDGGDNSITSFGWQQYSVWYPYVLPNRENGEGSRYKSSKIYEAGAYIPSEITRDVYSDDYFTAKLLNYIDSCQAIGQPYFAFYSMILCHKPLFPTPDDPEYDTWDFVHGKSSTKFFPSMVKYMDKKVGQIYDHLDSTNGLENTIIIFLSDNGTNPDVTSQWNSINVKGGKKKTNEPGTNVPLIIFQKGSSMSGTTSDALIDFTDFMPTFAAAAKVNIPAEWGIIDGVSFFRTLRGNINSMRSTIYNSYSININQISPFTRWVQDTSYKLYDTSSIERKFKFVKISKGHPDSAPITNLTPDEQVKYQEFMQVLREKNP